MPDPNSCCATVEKVTASEYGPSRSLPSTRPITIWSAFVYMYQGHAGGENAAALQQWSRESRDFARPRDGVWLPYQQQYRDGDLTGKSVDHERPETQAEAHRGDQRN